MDQNGFQLYLQWLEIGLKKKASDLHLKVGYRPYMRISGRLVELNDNYVISSTLMNEIINHLITTDLHRSTFSRTGSVDMGYVVDKLGYFRINIFRQSGTGAIVTRLLPITIPSFEVLGLPEVIKQFADFHSGLVLVTGTTGSGKSTTLASLINEINHKYHYHIITIEDPIEYRYENINSIISQRELGSDCDSFAGALRAALREDPDVILVGEMRDQDTIATVIAAAETGHLVFSTLHTKSAAKTVDRIISTFEASQQSNVASQLSTVLRAVVSQQLIPKADGNGLVCATEILIVNGAIANLIREGKNHQIDSNIQISKNSGMVTIEESLVKLVNSGVITNDEAYGRANNQAYFVSISKKK
jgi:twitching motility protein PilT